jgi:hypothetical protein
VERRRPLAHGVWSGWEELFPSTILYRIMLLAIGAAACFAVERISRRVLGGRER